MAVTPMGGDTCIIIITIINIIIEQHIGFG